MKVGFFGNMNNFGFCMVRYLRDLGYDAELVLFEDEAAHFHPTSDCFDLKYQSFTRSVNWGNSLRFSDVPIATVQRDVARYDQVWGCGVMPAYYHKMGKPLDLFVPYGSDLEGLTRFPGIPLRRQHLTSFFELPYRQRHGVQAHCRALAMDRAPWFEVVVEKLETRAKRIVESVPLIYLPVYADFASYRHRSFWAPMLEQIRARSELMIFHPTRHIWREGASPGARKGNDKLLRGFARLMQQSKIDAHLVATEYGPDASASKELAGQLGIADRVSWLPVLPRRELMVAMGFCDVVAGDYDVGWHTGGVVFEAYAAGKPLLHYREERTLTQAERGALPEIVQARTEHEVLDGLSELARRPEHYKAMGARAREWLVEHSGSKQVQNIAEAVGLRR